ncbi:hypothetical protein [Saccharophagus degradans]|uniref:hypothetical protein n=1 Tax=Saccharophagus degradans TaxID=86304 RepID=UPI001305449E|nr:hypothetical protein [Saccharophagus degradans]WGO97066.1 hypothetical protein QFX18_13540 [Saccharophagus degradans]
MQHMVVQVSFNKLVTQKDLMMKISSIFKAGAVCLFIFCGFSQANASPVNITISTYGNSNSNGTLEAWCPNSGTACKVIGNRDSHPGPRSCTMVCETGDTVVTTCKGNSSSRWIDDFNVPTNAVSIYFDYGDESTYGWRATGSTNVSCGFTD